MTPNEKRDLSGSLHEDLKRALNARPDKIEELPNNKILDDSIKPLQDDLNDKYSAGRHAGQCWRCWRSSK